MDSPASIWTHCLHYAAVSDVGLRRANNQDSHAVVLADSQADFEHRGHFFMVADGMGAHAAGELASKMATDTVGLVYRKRLDQPPPEAILSALLDANSQIHSRGQASPDFRGMGTTATTLNLLPSGALVAHVGDSRAYRLRGNYLEQLTFDHSLVWEIRAAGGTPDGELPGHISKNIITRSLGPSAVVQVDIEGPFPLHENDVFLLCSDGLSNQVKDDEIGIVLACMSPAEAVQALVDLALLRGGPDNITGIVIRVLGPQAARPSSDEGEIRSTPRATRPVHPLLWTTAGVALLAAVGLLAMGHALMALAALAVLAMTLSMALAKRYGQGDRGLQAEPRRFGRGPYVTCDCAPNGVGGDDFRRRLKTILDQLRETATKEDWPVDWPTVEASLAESRTTIEANQPPAATRAALQAIRTLLAARRRPQEVVDIRIGGDKEEPTG
jgi:protein phosphatase